GATCDATHGDPCCEGSPDTPPTRSATVPLDTSRPARPPRSGRAAPGGRERPSGGESAGTDFAGIVPPPHRRLPLGTRPLPAPPPAGALSPPPCRASRIARGPRLAQGAAVPPFRCSASTGRAPVRSHRWSALSTGASGGWRQNAATRFPATAG